MTVDAPPKRAASAPPEGEDAPPAKRPAPADLPPTPTSLNAMLLGSPTQWADADLRAYLHGRGVVFSTARTKRGSHAAFVTFASAADRSAADAALNGARLGRRKLKLRDATPAIRGGRDGSGARSVRAFKNVADIDVRDVVTPLWRVPYEDQLRQKRARVAAALAEIAARVADTDASAAPDWATAATIPLVGIVRSPVTAAYRNKNEFTAGHGVGGGPCVGFCLGAFRDGITEIGPPAGVAHVSRAAVALADGMARHVATASKLPVWDKRVNKGFWRLLTVREGRRATLIGDEKAAEPAFVDLDWTRWLVKEDGEEVKANEDATAAPLSDPASTVASIPHADTLAAIVQIDPTACADAQTVESELTALAAALRAAAAAVGAPAPSLALQHHTGVSNAAPPDAPLLPFPGEPASDALGAVLDSLCGLTFRVSPSAFFQVNTAAAAVLYRLAVDWAAPPAGGGVIYDVCCGTGTLGVCAAAVAAAQNGGGGSQHPTTTVLGVDIDAGAIADAAKNSAANGVPHARFVAGKAEDALSGLLSEGSAATTTSGAVAIVDPPRAGLHPRVRAALRNAPSVHRIVYVSCNPASLAVDAADLCSVRSAREGAPPPFVPVRAAAVDLFPHTSHVETVLLLERRKGDEAQAGV